LHAFSRLVHPLKLCTRYYTRGPPPTSTLFPYTTLFRSKQGDRVRIVAELISAADGRELWTETYDRELKDVFAVQSEIATAVTARSEEHTSELQSQSNLVCRLLLEKKKPGSWRSGRRGAG